MESDEDSGARQRCGTRTHAGRAGRAARRSLIGASAIGAVAAAIATALIGLIAPAPSAAAVRTPLRFDDLRWRLVGPFRGGWSEMVEGIPNRPDVFFFGAAGGGVWRTENAGRTWTPIFDRGTAAPVGAIAIAPSDPQTMYIGTGQPEPRYDVAGGAGVFRTHDGGKTWSPCGLAKTRHIGRIWVSPTDPDTLLVAAVGHFFGPNPERGVFRSTDGGRTWSHVLAIDSATGVVDLAADPRDANVIFAAAWQARQYPWQSYFAPVAGPGSGLYRSADGGRTWARIAGRGWPSGALGRISLATARTSSGLRVYAVISAGPASGLYRSDNGGTEWQRVNAESAFSGYYASRITVAPDDPNVVFTVGQSIRRCTRGGMLCTIVKGAPGGDDYHGVWINPAQPDHIATVSDQGTAISVDGGRSWSSWYNQPTGQFYHLAADDRFPYWIYSGQQDSGTVAIASRSDYGAIGYRDWHPVGGEERDDDIPDPDDPSIVYASGLGGSVTRYDARTGQVAFIGPYPLPNYGQRQTTTKHHFAWVTPLAVSQRGPLTLYLGGDALFASTNRGKRWSAISPDLTGKTVHPAHCTAQAVALAAAAPCGYGSIWSLAPSPRHGAEIWVGTDDGLIQLTRDGGRHWSNVTPAGVPRWAKVANIDVSALRDGVAYAAVDNQRQDDLAPYVWKTQDYGRTWQRASGNLPGDHFVSVVRADPMRPGLLYAGTETGVFVSFDDGRRWLPLQQNLPTAWVRDLLVHGNDLIAATQGRAIWVLDDVSPLREMSTAVPAGLPAYLFQPAPAFRLQSNNYRDTPLPPDEPVGSNPPAGAVIDYWLGQRAHGTVRIEIRDAEGHAVARLTSDMVPALNAAAYFSNDWIKPPAPLSRAPGLHRVRWNLRYERPRAISYDYSISATAGSDVPITPGGAFVLPGNYQIVLSVDGRVLKAPLGVRADPRVRIRRADLVASLALSQRIATGLTRAWRGYGEAAAARKQLAAVLATLDRNTNRNAIMRNPRDARLAQRVSSLLSSLEPAPSGPTFERESAILTPIETDLESVDAAPTASQISVAQATIARINVLLYAWVAQRRGDLAQLNRALRSAGFAPVTIPPPDRLRIDPPFAGEDSP